MGRAAVVSSFKPRLHDHGRCVADALEVAEALCAERGVRLTPTRRRVLELVWQSHAPVLAYDLLERLRREQPRAAPPTIYRALEFLCDQGFVHRIESLNAWYGCAEPGRPHSGQFLICSRCGAVAELDDGGIAALIEERARAAGFQARGQTVEVHGRCPACAAAQGPAL
jgi:Fur family zinc uptake transcriptional regulator